MCLQNLESLKNLPKKQGFMMVYVIQFTKDDIEYDTYIPIVYDYKGNYVKLEEEVKEE